MKFNWKKFLVCGVILAACTAAGAERPAPAVNVTKVIGVKQSITKKYIGNISAVDDVNLVARVSGKIELQNFNSGDMVKKGQLLFKLEDTTYIAQRDAAKARLAQSKAELATRKAELVFAKKNLERLTKLWESKATSEISYEEAVRVEATTRAAVAAAEASVQAAAAALKDAENQLSYTKIYAPFDGKAGKAAVSPFNYVTPATGTLVNVVKLTPLYVNFWISESDYMSLFGGSYSDLQKHALVKLQLADDSIYGENAEIVFIDNKVDADTDTIRVRGLVKNADLKLIPNALVTVELSRKESNPMPAVPASAVLNNGKIDFVYVVNADNTVAIRPVVTGELQGRLQVISKGLKIGETVVTRGVHKIMPIPGFKVAPVQE